MLHVQSYFVLKSLQDILRVFKMVIKFGIKCGIKDLENFDIKIPKKYQKNSKKLQILSKKDYQTLNLYLNSNFSFKNLGIKLALNTGMRIGEICALRWSDIDERLGVIRVSKTLQRVYFLEEGRSWTEVVLGKPKTCGSFREIPLNKDLINIFKTIKKIVRAECFILTNDIKPMEPRTFRSYFSRLVASLGVNSVNFHALRHSFATRCIECGGDYKTVSAILGHSNINTTLNLYVHPDLEQKRKCIVQMNKFLGI